MQGRIPGSACLSPDTKAAVRSALARSPADEIAASARLFCDGNRVRIVHVLHLAHELCVGDLTEVLGLEQSLVSHHLRVLRDGGVIASRREGPWVYYSLAGDEGLQSVQRRVQAVIENLRSDESYERGDFVSP